MTKLDFHHFQVRHFNNVSSNLSATVGQRQRADCLGAGENQPAEARYITVSSDQFEAS